MEAILFVGIQATGKSSFYLERFVHTHVRINLDMLRTRHREAILLRACLEMQQPFVVDNTNPTIVERAQYLAPAHAAGFRVVGYYFQSPVGAAIARNAARTSRVAIPPQAIARTHKKLQPPTLVEGFAELYCVHMVPGAGFAVEPWAEAAR